MPQTRDLRLEGPSRAGAHIEVMSWPAEAASVNVWPIGRARFLGVMDL
jgi:hypothetical protein